MARSATGYTIPSHLWRVAFKVLKSDRHTKYEKKEGNGRVSEEAVCCKIFLL